MRFPDVGFMLFVAYFVLIYVYTRLQSPPWNASKLIRNFGNDLLDKTKTHALVVRGFGRGVTMVARR
jgi:hypothetical protein